MLLDYLQENGYDPEADELNASFGGVCRDTFDLTVSGVGTVRLCTYPNDAYTTELYLFDAFMVETWSARFYAAPEAAIVATLATAEDELAARRGGPVTQRQIDAR